jgi:hypothetical protein
MKQLALVAVGTVLVFVAGVFTGRWYELRRPLPPPPGRLMGEFGGHAGGWPAQPFSRGDFKVEVEKLRAQIETYRKSVDLIEDQFERELDPILTPAQRMLRAEHLKRRAEFRTAMASRKLTDDQFVRLGQWPNMELVRVVVLQLGYDDLNRELKLQDDQRDKVKELLLRRRERFLALTDSTPPPSLALMRLVPYAQRMAPPPRPSEPPPAAQP